MIKQKQVDKKFVLKIWFFSTGVFVLFCVLQILDYSLINQVNIENIDQEGKIEWEIDLIRADTNYVAITGWAFIPGEQPKNMSINIVLENLSTNDSYKLPTTLIVREDINDHYTDEIDYSKSGFISRVNKHFLDLDNDSYMIYIEFLDQGEVIYIETEKILSALTGD